MCFISIVTIYKTQKLVSQLTDQMAITVYLKFSKMTNYSHQQTRPKSTEI